MSQRKTGLLMMFYLGVAFFTSAIVTNAQDFEMRTWWSEDGSESIRASFESFDKKSKIVTLRDRDNEEVTVELTQLSRDDRSYVARSQRRKSKVFRKNSAEAGPKDEVESKENKKRSAKRKPKVFKRYGIDWIKGIEIALAQASDEENRKPVMWFRVLGDLNGLM